MIKGNIHMPKLRMHPVRLLLYMALYLLNFFMYQFLYSYFNLIIWVVMTVLFVVSVLFIFLLKKNLKIYISTPEGGITVGETGKARLRVVNPNCAFSLDAKVTVGIENTFYGTAGQVELSLPILFKKEKTVYLPLSFDLCGKIQLTIQKIEVWDLLGIFSVQCPSKAKASIFVIPGYSKPVKSWANELAAGVTESEESSAKGNDFSEISGIREYNAGDRMKDIHWKISAKKEKLMVKERVSMSDERLFVVIDLSGTKEQTEMVLEKLYSILKDMENRMDTKVCWWNPAQGEFQVLCLKEVNKLEEVFPKIYACKIQREQVDTIQYMKTIMKQVSSYVYISAKSQSAKVTIQENR